MIRSIQGIRSDGGAPGTRPSDTRDDARIPRPDRERAGARRAGTLAGARRPGRRLVALVALAALAGVPAGAWAQDRSPPEHTVSPRLLGARDTTYTVPLDFAERVEYDMLDVLRISDSEGRLLDPGAGIGLTSVNPRVDDAAGRWVAAVEVADSVRRPRRVVVNVYPQGAQMPHTRVAVPLLAPRPSVSRVRFRAQDGAWTDTLRVAPGERSRVDVRVDGGPFFDGVDLELEGYDIDVDSIRSDAVFGTLEVESRPSTELRIGRRTLEVRDSVSGWRVEATAAIRGAPPEFVEVPQLEARGGYQPLTVQVRDVAPGARFRVLPASPEYPVPEQTLVPEIDSHRVALSVHVPELPSGVNGAEFRLAVVNPDERRATTRVGVSRPPSRTVRAQPGDVTFGVPTRVEFVALSGTPRFDGRHTGGYAVTAGAGAGEIELDDQRVTMEGERLLGDLRIALEELDNGAESQPVTFTIAGPEGQRWRGDLRVAARPEVREPTVVRLRPGEERDVNVSGVHLDGIELIGDEDVTVAWQALSARGGTVRLAAASTAEGTSRLELLDEGRRIGSLTVEIRPWTRPDALARTIRWRAAADADWRPWTPGAERIVTVDPDAEIAFRAEGTEQVPWAEERVRFRVETRGGRVVWRDSLTLQPERAARTRTFFRPGAVLEDGRLFVLRATGPGGQLSDQTFRVAYDRDALSLDRLALLPGVAAVQWTPGNDRVDSGLFQGVSAALTYGLDAIDNTVGRSGVIEPAVMLFLSKPQQGDGGAGGGGDAATGPAPVRIGAGAGVALLRQLFLSAGYDGRGPTPGESWFLTLGATFDLRGIAPIGLP